MTNRKFLVHTSNVVMISFIIVNVILFQHQFFWRHNLLSLFNLGIAVVFAAIYIFTEKLN